MEEEGKDPPKLLISPGAKSLQYALKGGTSAYIPSKKYIV